MDEFKSDEERERAEFIGDCKRDEMKDRKAERMAEARRRVREREEKDLAEAMKPKPCGKDGCSCGKTEQETISMDGPKVAPFEGDWVTCGDCGLRDISGVCAGSGPRNGLKVDPTWLACGSFSRAAIDSRDVPEDPRQGLTEYQRIRAELAGMAMQGILANVEGWRHCKENNSHPLNIRDAAIWQADLILEKLGIEP